MSRKFSTENSPRNNVKPRGYKLRWSAISSFNIVAVALLFAAVGCKTAESKYSEATLPVPEMAKSQPASISNSTNVSASESLVLREGDTVRISFPGAPNLDTVQQIRRDGKIALKLVGEFQAVGLTPSAMEKELIKLYGPQLQTKEVTVTLESSAFAIYVTGAVLRPGKIISDRPLSALEAIMEAGGFDYSKANMKSVNIVRQENGASAHYTINLKRALKEGDKVPFKLKPSDIIYVPERFQWF